MKDNFNKFDPAVDKKFLVALSGIMWSVVGIMLCKLAVGWLSQTTAYKRTWLGAAGIMLSLMIHHFGFLKLVDRNIARILAKKGKVCIFGFQPWKSYLIIAFMIGMGTALRHSSLPRQYLAIIYISMGGAMLLSSIRYYRTFIKLVGNKT
ncbi:MAG: hypothetical protein HY757_07580 [Nitrospirae bacterium]|nr:hypothetical protein [Nitrospirota bacterium]